MYTLYYAPGAASLVVHWLLIDLGLPHELIKLDIATREHKTPEYLAINPHGVVPTLLVDGKPMCEAAAMAVLLAEAKVHLYDGDVDSAFARTETVLGLDPQSQEAQSLDRVVRTERRRTRISRLGGQSRNEH
jgi:glutathione S-transferase